MDDLVSFWRARLDEAEAAAMLAAKRDPAPWTMAEFGELRNASGREVFGPGGYEAVCFWDDTAQFVASHEPGRVLREVEADRRLLAEMDQLAGDIGWDDAIMFAVKCRAAVFSEHPDYQAGWKQ